MDSRVKHLCANWNRSPSETMSISNMLSTPAIPDCGPALSLCTANHDGLLRAVIALSILVGILFTTTLMLLWPLCFKRQHGREGPFPVEKGTRTTESVVEQPEKSDGVSADVVNKSEEVAVLHFPQGSGPSSLESPLEVQGAIEDSRTLSQVSSTASVYAFSDDGHCPCVEAAIVSHSFKHHTDLTLPLPAVSVENFDQGQDEVFHPEVRALVEEGNFTKDAVRHLKPVAPKADAVIPNYNPILDEARPETMNEYLHNYRILFVIDDSTSMRSHWYETRDALSEIAAHALKYHSKAVDIRFLNARYQASGIQGSDKVMGIFDAVSPSGCTPTGRVLKEVLDKQLNRLNDAQRKGTYSSERPLDIIVLTDGVPDHDSPPAPVIKEAARRLKATGHHQNWVGIQFVQIGNDPDAEPTLLSLIDSADNNHMVDTISYSFYKDEGGGRLTPQILERIILGGLHPNLRSYYNQFRREVNERTSQTIY